MTSTSTLHPSFKLWLSAEGSKAAFGDGKWQLLQAINTTGTLQAAAKSLHVSYRKAWGDLQKIEDRLGLKLCERRRGGKSRGETRLTAVGKRLLSAYGRFRSDIERAVSLAYEEHILKPGGNRHD